MGINCLQLLTRTYFITWCIIKLHTLLPQDTMGSENRKMGEQKMGGTSLISPTGQCRSLQTNKHQAVSGEVIFFHHAVVLNSSLGKFSPGHFLDVFTGSARTNQSALMGPLSMTKSQLFPRGHSLEDVPV